MVPLSVYEALCKECDDLHASNNELKSAMDVYTEGIRGQHDDPVLVTRLTALITGWMRCLH